MVPSELAPAVVELRYDRVAHYAHLGGVAVVLAMAGIGWMAYWVEGARIGLIACVPLLVTGICWLVALLAAPYAVDFGANQLVVRRWMGTRVLRYDAITGAVFRRFAIVVQMQTTNLLLPRLFAHDDARLFQAIETHVPAAQAARARRLAAGFPVVLQGRLAASLLAACSGLVFVLAGLGLVWYALSPQAELEGFEQAEPLVFGLLCIGIGALFVGMLFSSFAYRTILTREAMTQHFLLHRTTHSMLGLVRVEMGATTRTTRGRNRRVYHIAFTYTNGTVFQWIPDEFSFPMAYIDAEAAYLASELCERLRRAYGCAAD